MTPKNWLRHVLTARASNPSTRAKIFARGLEKLDDRIVPAVSGTRSIDETNNNIANPTYGTAGTDLIRLAPVGYADGVSSPALPRTRVPGRSATS
ncbi:peroxidase family protein [Fimbriiglobus ruber]|uniref:Uncharacterized protein n=1 Tax=Fimbriiglobus ruber TaxID=1908690 RepID=A0A225E0S9_9BACT|nr:hypothetical protein FRUB_00891 [Fimbriiglobus ruber]